MQTTHLERTLRRLRTKHLSRLPITHGDFQTALALQDDIEQLYPDSVLHHEAIDLVEALSVERFPPRDFETYLADLSERFAQERPSVQAPGRLDSTHEPTQASIHAQRFQQALKVWTETNESEVFI
jgi:hypothetical protein